MGDVPSLDATAVTMRRAVGEGWPDSDFVRLLAQAVEDFDHCDAGEERDRFLAEPQLTGSDVWDAALAALAVHLCRREGRDVTPAWTREPCRFTSRMAWIGLPPGSALQAYVFQRTPAYFKGRGVMLNVQNLASV